MNRHKWHYNVSFQSLQILWNENKGDQESYREPRMNI
jgi:hypothetical protein